MCGTAYTTPGAARQFTRILASQIQTWASKLLQPRMGRCLDTAVHAGSHEKRKIVMCLSLVSKLSCLMNAPLA